MRKLLRILPLLFLPLLAAATHQVSGYISFKHMYGTTYQVTLVNYTNGDPPTSGACSDADRDTIRLYYGDGTSDLLIRSNGNPDQYGYPGGVTVCPCRKVNIYTNSPDGITGGHQFTGGAASYHMWFDDQNRMAAIINIPNSVQTDFYLFTAINFNITTGEDISSPVLGYPTVCENACTGQCYYYNVGAYSAEGDSISYSLGNCMRVSGTGPPLDYAEPISGYFIPSGATIDRVTGTLEWCNPTNAGIYNFSIRMISYKRVNISGTSITKAIDTMDVELEITVNSTCTQNPEITGPSDTCIVAGTLLNMNYIGTDIPDTFINPVTLSAAGQPFSLSPSATFSTQAIGKGTPPAHNPELGKFSWQTNCSDVRSAPYQLTIKASAGNPSLSVYKTTNIHVIAPPPTNFTAKVLGNSVYLHWNPSACASQTSVYYIYRASGCVKFQPSYCETGVPASSGYVLIGSTDSTHYTDLNVIPGLNYSYLIVGGYPLPDGSLSVASNDTCVLIRRNLPLITNVSVDNTSPNSGTIFVRWTRPLADSGYLDTSSSGFPGPYKYKLWRATGMNSTNFDTVVDSVISPFFGSRIDTTYKEPKLNTQGNSYRYKVDFYYENNKPIGSSSAPSASSIYLSAKPGNNIMQLSWASNVPWTDSTYSIYREDPPPASTFNLLKTVPGNVHSYTDSILTNTKTYCYYVESKSYYADPTILHPLFDSSEVICAAPKDTAPPCAPQLSVSAKCNTYMDSLVWNNPDHFCPNNNDILLYKIYYASTTTGNMQLFKTINNINDTLLVLDSLNSVAGCYAVTAVDSAGNESSINKVCVDNCPVYILPNVFTPGGAEQNDMFTPVLPYRYVQSIDINIYNRWGQLMFHTTNPMINWTGVDQTTHGECPDGVYYYVCTVNEIRVTGIQPIVLKGFVQIIRK